MDNTQARHALKRNDEAIEENQGNPPTRKLIRKTRNDEPRSLANPSRLSSQTSAYVVRTSNLMSGSSSEAEVDRGTSGTKTQTLWSRHAKSESQTPQTNNSSDIKKGRETIFDRSMQSAANSYRISWCKSCMQMKVDSDFKNNLMAFHLGSAPLSKTLLKRHLFRVGQLFSHFAFQQPEFSSLLHGDQRRLLQRNTMLFINYILARYATAPSGKEQIAWLIVSQIHNTGDLSEGNFKKIDFEKIFTNAPADKMAEYVSMAESLKHPLLDIKLNFLVALACLFTSSSSFLDCPLRVQRHLEEILQWADWAQEGSFLITRTPDGQTLNNIVLKTEKLASLFEELSYWDVNELRDEHEITLFRTCEEDIWIATKLDDFTFAFDSVSVGEKTLEDMVMLNFDVPPSKNFVNRIYATAFERSRRILKNHEVFGELSNAEQNALIKANAFTFTAVMGLRSQAMPDGYFQLKFVTGSKDHLLIKEKYQNLIQNGRKLKKLSLCDINRSAGDGLLPKQSAKHFDQSVDNIMEFAKNLTVFQLLSLVVLFDSSCLTDPKPGLVNLENVYRQHLFRKVSHRNTSTDVNKLFHDLQELSKILKQIQELAIQSESP